MCPMADLHSHLLSGVDDGSKTPEQSVEVLKRMASDEVTAVCLTPHLTVSDLVPVTLAAKLEKYAAAYELLSSMAPNTPSLYRGVELMIDMPLPPEGLLDRRITLGGSRYLLVEFPHQFSAEAIRQLLGSIVKRGLIPVIAHPERYAATTVEAVYTWREQGAAVQVDATTVARGKGSRAIRARSILEAGLADILAADNHGDGRTLGAVSRYLRNLGADAQREYLVGVNPFAMLRDEALEPVPPFRKPRGIRQIIARLFR
jgi:protein-tyrosine phosphatase